MKGIAIRTCVVIVSSCWTLLSIAATGDAIAGKEKSALCQGCHGEAGSSAIADYPKLAGQYDEYIVKQLMDFQMQNRRDSRMSPIAEGMSNVQDIRDIAAYFASLPMMKGTQQKGVSLNAKALELGRMIFENGIPERGVAPCTSCHGDAGKGKPKNNPMFPIIGGQHKKYAVKQLKEYESGTRNTDMTGAMEQIVKALNKDEIDAVAEYAAGL